MNLYDLILKSMSVFWLYSILKMDYILTQLFLGGKWKSLLLINRSYQISLYLTSFWLSAVTFVGLLLHWSHHSFLLLILFISQGKCLGRKGSIEKNTRIYSVQYSHDKHTIVPFMFLEPSFTVKSFFFKTTYRTVRNWRPAWWRHCHVTNIVSLITYVKSEGTGRWANLEYTHFVYSVIHCVYWPNPHEIHTNTRGLNQHVCI